MKKVNLTLIVVFLFNVSLFAQSLGGNGNSVYLLKSDNTTSPIYFGIGTKSPSHKLMIQGDEATFDREFLRLHNTNTGFNSAVGIKLTASDNSTTFGNISYAGSTYTNGVDVDDALNVYTNGKSLNLMSSGIIRFRINTLANPEVMRISNTGNIGIAVTAPTAILHTKGKVRMQDLSAGASFILTADADGNLLKSTTLLTDLNTKIADLSTRLLAAEDEIKTLKKKVGFASPIEQHTQLFQNEPNPVTNNTKIKFFTPEQVNKANIFIFDLNGRMIQQFELFNVAGNQEININANTFEAGMYFYTLLLDGKEVDTKKMFITK
jgi:hypothetical protein